MRFEKEVKIVEWANRAILAEIWTSRQFEKLVPFSPLHNSMSSEIYIYIYIYMIFLDIYICMCMCVRVCVCVFNKLQFSLLKCLSEERQSLHWDGFPLKPLRTVHHMNSWTFRIAIFMYV